MTSDITGELTGQLAALLAAAFWAVATVLYHRAGSHFSPLQMNLVKGVVATPLLLIMSLLLGNSLELSSSLWLLALSGIIGITIGDSCHFAALRRLGPWHAMLLEYLAPPIAAFMAWAFLSDGLSTIEITGAVITLSGVLWVVTEKAPDKQPALSLSGIFFGCGAALCQATGLVMAFAVLKQSSVNAIDAAFVRLAAGSFLLAIIVGLSKRGAYNAIIKQVRSINPLPLLGAIVFGTFLAIWLQQISIANINPGLTQTLLSTAPLFLIPISLLKKQRITSRSITGALIALGGISILFL
ncbi:UNVERIFIED_ORG: EamA-like transporter family protein [Idiomarina abyssalis]|mgnify:FL=1|uniref:Predicted permease, DMT superfamily n=1 Tax=Idiomarina loihiensis (strain ATCC BAA-735 / DSM 15497 / L2-TR) TaxID=283942 RepID=Q5QYN3_IDILO|nr:MULTISPECIES: DMT family transporter [Idiomarina]AAV82240.1 Predicted permease, DMT superfamily [Idiomarina loihiensis L2TR]AGM36270.1 DMT superfamily permease [Idiomarina loihiensis GSL 199]MAA62535.1 EamA family transporter [Idiomarina sp.]TDO53671.1 EamA-like transporter family protein [Idiomarina sp. 017G]